MKTTLKAKVLELIKILGYETSYAKNFLYSLEQAENPTEKTLYQIYNNSVTKEPSEIYSTTWSLEHLIGETLLLIKLEQLRSLCVLLNLFKLEQ